MIIADYIELLQTIEDSLTSYNITGYLVGGLLRDTLLSKDISQTIQYHNDLDIALYMPAKNYSPKNALSLLNKVTETIATKINTTYTFIEYYATTKIHYIYADKTIVMDYTITRKEEYKTVGAIPIIILGNNTPIPIEEDLYRRDFTCNAIACTIKEYIDFLENTVSPQYILLPDTITDINSLTIANTHTNSFFEDPTRILRMFTYMQKFSFIMKEETYKEYIKACKHTVFNTLSHSRLAKALEYAFIKTHSLADLIALYIEYTLFPLFFGYPKDIPHLLESIKYFENTTLFTLSSSREKLFLLYSILTAHSLHTIYSTHTKYIYNKKIPFSSSKKIQNTTTYKQSFYINALHKEKPFYKNYANRCYFAYKAYLTLVNTTEDNTQKLEYVLFLVQLSNIQILYLLLQKDIPCKLFLEDYLTFRYNGEDKVLFEEKDIPSHLVKNKKIFYQHLKANIFLKKLYTKEEQLLYISQMHILFKEI